MHSCHLPISISSQHKQHRKQHLYTKQRELNKHLSHPHKQTQPEDYTTAAGDGFTIGNAFEKHTQILLFRKLYPMLSSSNKNITKKNLSSSYYHIKCLKTHHCKYSCIYIWRKNTKLNLFPKKGHNINLMCLSSWYKCLYFSVLFLFFSFYHITDKHTHVRKAHRVYVICRFASIHLLCAFDKPLYI